MGEGEGEGGEDASLTPLWERIAAVAAGGAGSAAAGLWLGPEASLLAGPLAAEAMEAALERTRTLRQRNASLMLEEAARIAATSDVSAVDLLEGLTSDPARMQLFAAALDAAARAIADAKLRMLGQALANGSLAQDDAQLNLELLIVRALADIEAPHLRVLDRMYPRQKKDRYWDAQTPVEGNARAFSLEELYGNTRTAQISGWTGFPELGEGLDSVLATLRAHGLLEEGTSNVAEWIRKRERSEVTSPFDAPAPPGLKITALGCRVFERFLDAGAGETGIG
jgi:hypothetical protein